MCGKPAAVAALFVILRMLSGGQTPMLHAEDAKAIQGRWSAASFIPMPRKYSPVGPSSLRRGIFVISDSNAEDRFAARDLESWFESLGVSVKRKSSAFRVRLLRADSKEGKKLLRRAAVQFDPAMHDEGYVIVPSTNELAVLGETAAGLFYGAQTVKQMVTGRGDSAEIERASVGDWPAMHYRGLSDDLSRGAIPTLKYQEQIIRTLAAYKMNLYSPYFENTFAYRSDPLPALPGESLNQGDMKALVAYASQYHVMVVPEQESFGHLHQVLIYQKNAPVAETPLGTTLAPGQPASLDLIREWFTELGATFPAPSFHIGADETHDLGIGRTKGAVRAQGTGPVYVDFLIKIHAALAPLHRRLLFWGDITMKDPAQVKRLPKDMIAVAWTYFPDPNGYERWIQPFTNAGLETWVAPGIGNWKRVYPDNDHALRNIQGFVAVGQAEHSTGMLNTDWNDDGEGLWPENWYGVLFGAAAAWQPGQSSIEQYEDAYGPVFQGDRTGKINEAQHEMTAIYQLLHKSQRAHRAELNWEEATDYLYWIDPWGRQRGVSGPGIAASLLPILPQLRSHAERVITLVAEARAAGSLRHPEVADVLDLGARRFDFIGQKFQTADEIARMYRKLYAYSRQPGDPSAKSAHILAVLQNISENGGLCQDMSQGFSWTRERYSSLWLEVNRPYWLRNVQLRYDLAAELWTRRGHKFRQLELDWRMHVQLPTPEQMGIPPEPGPTSKPQPSGE